MNTLNYYYYFKLSIRYIRGYFYRLISGNFGADRLRVGSGVAIFGNQIKIGKRVKIANNVSIYKNVDIGNGVIIGDNVELRCNLSNAIRIGNNCTINRNSMIMGNVIIGNDCMIAPDCVVVGSNHIFSDVNRNIKSQGISSKGIIIEDNVWLGAKAVVVDGVSIGSGSVIGAASVVTKDIPQNSIAIGNPCRVIKTRE